VARGAACWRMSTPAHLRRRPRPSHRPLTGGASRVRHLAAGRRWILGLSLAGLAACAVAADLNHATRADLESVPGIGPVLAERWLGMEQAGNREVANVQP